MPHGYRAFATRRRAELRAAGRAAETAAGPVEYADAGPRGGIPILTCHGSPGGFDQAWLLDPLLALDRRARKAAAERILADGERLAVMRRLMLSLTPYEDRAAGLRNDLDGFAGLDDTLTDGVACPTLVLHGSHDGDAGPEHARHAARTIAGATLHMVPGAWHVLRMSDDYPAVSAVTGSFLATIAER